MDSVTKYNVYKAGVLIASYNSQAPATTYAARVSRRNKETVEVVEEVFGHVSSRRVREAIEGAIYKC